MARPILPLPDHLINQIAAGEVVERPASVIKELVENSLDAGATRIDIDVGEGGLAYMTVSDDGVGMAGEELAAALRRHWTSKIAEVGDLANLLSLGFRGEALASIASVATVEIVTRRRADGHGWRLRVAPGQTPAAPEPHKANVGTRITVSELFHNVPARRRFLKRARTEFLHIQQLVRQLAFARPEVTMSLSQSGSRGLRLPPAALGGAGARWRSLFGSEFVSAARYVEVTLDDVSVRGWIGDAAQADSQSDGQFLALNGRYVRDRQLAHAVRLAYGEAIPAGRFPVYGLAVTVAPSAVDVNVHPGKLEVRFADVRAVHDVLYVAVRRALEAQADGAAEAPPSHAGHGIAEAPRDYGAGRVMTVVPSRAPPPPVAAQLGTPLALVDDRHLLFRDGEQVRALDLREAWTAVLAARLAARSAGDDAGRPLLIPERIAGSAPLWRRCTPATLRTLGFELDDLGPAGYLLRAVPRVLPELPWHLFCTALADAPPGDGWRWIAAAAAAALDLGSHGHASRRLLEQLEQGAAACGLPLAERATLVDSALLAASAARRD